MKQKQKQSQKQTVIVNVSVPKKRGGKRGTKRPSGVGSRDAPMAIQQIIPPIPMSVQQTPQPDFASQFIKALASMGEGVPAIKGNQLNPQITLNNPNVANKLIEGVSMPSTLQGPMPPLSIGISGMNTLTEALKGVQTPATAPSTPTSSSSTISYPERRVISDKSTKSILEQMSNLQASSGKQELLLPSQPAVSTDSLPRQEAIEPLRLPPQASVSVNLVPRDLPPLPPRDLSSLPPLPVASDIQPSAPRTMKRMPKKPTV